MDFRRFCRFGAPGPLLGPVGFLTVVLPWRGTFLAPARVPPFGAAGQTGFSKQIKSIQIKSNLIKTNEIKIESNQIESNQIKSNQIKSNQIKSNLSLPPFLHAASPALHCILSWLATRLAA